MKKTTPEFTSTAIIGRLPCGCVVAVDFEDTAVHRAVYRQRGYAVSIVPHAEARALVAGLRYPCEHKRLDAWKKSC